MYDAFTNHHLNLYAAASEIIGPAMCDDPRVIVDAACGMGHGFALLGCLGRYIGLDRDEHALAESRKRYPAGEFRYADFSSRRWLSGIRPDVVVSLETAEHLDDPQSFLRRIALALRPGGLFVFSVPTCLTRDFDPFHRWDFTASTWRALLIHAGFLIESTQDFKIEGSFREFLSTVPTTRWQKARVALFNLTHPGYLIDRLCNWILRDRFWWQSTLFVCRPSLVERAQSYVSWHGVEATK